MKIITLGKYGALGNNFFRFIHACAFSKEYNTELYYSDRRNIDKYFKVDPKFIQHKRTAWIINNRFLRDILRRIDKFPRMVKLLNRLNIYLHDHVNRVQKDEQLALAGRRKNSIVFALRDFRAHSAMVNYVDDMRKAFDIKPELTIKINVEYQELRKKYKLLLGVHVRRGDYREWRNGKYYFPDEVYAKKIREFLAFIDVALEDAAVVICSNGAPLIENYAGLNAFFTPRPEEEDLFLMKRCDYIIGPPSTFCSMSSFMGSVPLYFIEDEVTTDFEERLHICSY